MMLVNSVGNPKENRPKRNLHEVARSHPLPEMQIQSIKKKFADTKKRESMKRSDELEQDESNQARSIFPYLPRMNAEIEQKNDSDPKNLQLPTTDSSPSSSGTKLNVKKY